MRRQERHVIELEAGEVMKHDVEHNNGSNNGHEKSRRMKKGAIPWPGKNPRDQPANHRASNANEGGFDKTHVLHRRHHMPRNETNDKTDDNRPENVEHNSLNFVLAAALTPWGVHPISAVSGMD
ncbi:MAG: hypothetical protein LV481_00165 [Methylacidiphilales bacterium]|nr:hypothetical protein [Candidatus Methylacidiphilales bacterium]